MSDHSGTDSTAVTNGATAVSAPALAAVARAYGAAGLQRLGAAHVCVVGIGGVGSWIVEALARSGIGQITLIDHDDVSEGNINRQVHADYSTLDHSKVEVMASRIKAINPACQCHAIDDMLVDRNIDKYIDNRFDYVIDAIDSVRFKASLIYFCKRNDIPILTVGGAGGRTDPAKVAIVDLSKTWNDALAANVRRRLRSEYGWTRNPKRRFGVDCIFSCEQARYPKSDGSVAFTKPGVPGATLDCDSGYGSLVTVTATFGLIAAAAVMNKLVDNR
jgi:tRNA A37 threonylcarbamoyladenosine dehydratase